MSFLAGILFVIPLALFTVILFYLSKFVPKEAVQLPIFFMIAGDGILVALWYFGLRELVEDRFRKDFIICGYSYDRYLKGK